MDAQAERRPSVARLAAALRALVADGEAPGLVLALSLIFARHMRFDAADPSWPDRDRLLVDPGLGDVGKALTDLTGAGFGAPACGEPVLGLGVGAALAERLLAARFGRSLVDHRTWVVLPEACLPEGPVFEAAQLAASWTLSRLVVLVSVARTDAAGLSGFGAAGWAVRRVPAADGGEIAAAISAALRAQRPTLLACLRGEAAPEPADDATLAESRAEGQAAWAIAARRGMGVRRAWLKRRARHASRADFDAALGGRLPPAWHQAFFAAGLPASAEDAVSTEACVRQSIRRLISLTPEVTQIAAPGEALARLYRGLADAAVGAALHGGIVPVLAGRLLAGVSFDAALRASAAGAKCLVIVLDEPETGAGAEGYRAALRALPFLPVYRPADAQEAMECAELAFRHPGPGVLLLSRAPAKPLGERPSRTRCLRGGYVLAEAIGPRAATLIASGPEVALALKVQDRLAAQDLEIAVVSLPCWHAFFRQEPAWRGLVLGDAPRIGLEPGGGFGWGALLGQDGLFIGLATLPPSLWGANERDAAAACVAGIVARHIEGRRAIFTGRDTSPKRTGMVRPG